MSECECVRVGWPVLAVFVAMGFVLGAAWMNRRWRERCKRGSARMELMASAVDSALESNRSASAGWSGRAKVR